MYPYCTLQYACILVLLLGVYTSITVVYWNNKYCTKYIYFVIFNFEFSTVRIYSYVLTDIYYIYTSIYIHTLFTVTIQYTDTSFKLIKYCRNIHTVHCVKHSKYSCTLNTKNKLTAWEKQLFTSLYSIVLTHWHSNLRST